MKLVDRILDLLQSSHGGLSLKAARKALGHDSAKLKAAFLRLDQSGRARLFRRGRGGAVYLMLADAAILICAATGCRKEFQRKPKSKRLTCSKGCATSYAWRDPVKAAKRAARISAVAKEPAHLERLPAHNAKRWADPKQHEKLVEQNRREWKKPEKAAIRAAKIRLKHQRPESRKKYSDLRKSEWNDPVTRAARLAAQNKSKKTQAYRAKMRRLAIERNKSPEFRAMVIARNKATANNPILKKRASERMKALWADPVWAAATSQKIREARVRA